MRFCTLKDVDAAGLDLRVWCQGCGRTHDVDGSVWLAFAERGWSIDLIEARRRFRCTTCRSAELVVLVPARRPPAEPAKSWTAEVEAFFHANRKGKRLFVVPKPPRQPRR